MIKPDILVEIRFKLNDPDKTTIRTNASRDGLQEVIETWLVDQIGKGRDERPPERKEEYLVRIGLRLEDDAFGLESDTGNDSLTCGLVRDVLARLDTLEISPLD